MSNRSWGPQNNLFICGEVGTGGQCVLSVQGGGLSVSGDAFTGPGANVKILPTLLLVSKVSPTFDD